MAIKKCMPDEGGIHDCGCACWNQCRPTLPVKRIAPASSGITSALNAYQFIEQTFDLLRIAEFAIRFEKQAQSFCIQFPGNQQKRSQVDRTVPEKLCPCNPPVFRAKRQDSSSRAVHRIIWIPPGEIPRFNPLPGFVYVGRNAQDFQRNSAFRAKRGLQRLILYLSPVACVSIPKPQTLPW
jgi:hypothetical protein